MAIAFAKRVKSLLILIHYARTKLLWMFLLSIFGQKWVFLTIVKILLLEWKFKGLDKKSRHIWQMVLYVGSGVYEKSEIESLTEKNLQIGG